MAKISINKENVKTLFDAKFLRVVDLQYAPGKHYFNATRRSADDLAAIKSDEEFKTMLPDAVSCVVILDRPGEEPQLLLSYEFRYPAGRFLLSVPAGLIDEQDKAKPDPIVSAAIREIKEETGLDVKESDSVTIVNPLLFSTPGMTDESNALVCVILRSDSFCALSQEGAEGSELFDGFELLTREEALEVLQRGRDKAGNYYPLYTWAVLAYFVSDVWKNQAR